MPAHKPVDPKLLSDARAGRLKRANTRPGTPERRAVDRATYLARTASRRPGISARKAAGHGQRRGNVPAYLAGQPAVRQVEVDYRTAKRIGKYDALTGQLFSGRMSAEEFDRRTGRWVPITVRGGDLPAGTYRFASAAEALAQWDALRAGDGSLDFDVEGS